MHFNANGTTWHSRFFPKIHHFEYSLAMLLIDLDEINNLFRSKWAGIGGLYPVSINTNRHLFDLKGMDANLVRKKVLESTKKMPEGKVYLLTTPGIFGLTFNPICVYFVHDINGQPDTIILEVSNTPWNKIHRYILPVRGLGNGKPIRFSKNFHVSPFNPMDQEYELNVTWPNNVRLSLTLELFSGGANKPLFSAGLNLDLSPFDGRSVKGIIKNNWFQPFSILGKIYYEALKLKCKGLRYHSPPKNNSDHTGTN